TGIQGGEKTAVDQHLSIALRWQGWNIKPVELWGLATKNRRQADWLASLHNHDDASLRTLAAWLQWLAEIADTENLPTIIDYILGLRTGSGMTSPIKDYFKPRSTITTDYVRGLSAIRALLAQ